MRYWSLLAECRALVMRYMALLAKYWALVVRYRDLFGRTHGSCDENRALLAKCMAVVMGYGSFGSM